MKRLLSLSILLALAVPAGAATFTGTLERVYLPAPTEENPRNKEQVHRLRSSEGLVVLEELEPFAPLGSLVDRGQITLEGELVEGRLRVTRIAAPSVERLEGTVYRTKKGWAGQVLIQLEGQKKGTKTSGLPWLAFRTLTEDMSRHQIEFDAFPIRDSRGRLKELVVTRVKATASEDLILTRNLLSYRGEVPQGQTVWLTRRSLMGISALVVGPNGQTGFALWSRLQIGEPVTVNKGAVDHLKGSR
ncbi:MAG: hypothetical protein JKY65_08345 [Planctomycetes bacterium]|nr:hypothetical protein [Planctomycetota bacterium]